jgi:hypothetical protein
VLSRSAEVVHRLKLGVRSVARTLEAGLNNVFLNDLGDSMRLGTLGWFLMKEIRFEGL